MITNIDKNPKYILLKAFRDGKPVFVRCDDECAKQTFRDKHKNKNLLISPNLYTGIGPFAEQICPLRFHVVAKCLEKTRKSTIEACYYINEHLDVSTDHIHIIFNSGAEIFLLIPATVFYGKPTPLIQIINYKIARQMADDGIKNIDFDTYEKDYCMPLVNSKNSDTNRYVILLEMKELLYMSAGQILELSKKPRQEDLCLMPKKDPDAIEMFSQLHKQAEKENKRQQALLELMHKQGWQIPPCIRNLTWIETGFFEGLEACRLIAQFYASIGAGEYEIFYQINRWAQRNAYKNHKKLRAIITFAIENPCLLNCQHALLRRYCPAGKCFMAELIDEYEKPRLFM